MAGPAAVDQKRRAGGAQAGVAEALEEGRRLVVEVPHVQVVDRVVEGAEEAEGAGRLPRGAVLDVAPLGPVVPVHPRDPVPVGADAGRDLRGADRRHRREAGDAVADQLAALEQLREGRRVAGVDRPLEHVGAQRVDDDEDELALHGRSGCQSGRTGIGTASLTVPEDPQALVLLARLAAAAEGEDERGRRRRAARPAARRARARRRAMPARRRSRTRVLTAAVARPRRSRRCARLTPRRGRRRRSARRPPSTRAPTINPGQAVSPSSASEAANGERAGGRRAGRSAGCARARGRGRAVEDDEREAAATRNQVAPMKP